MNDRPQNYFEAIGEAQARKVHERRVATIKQEKTQDDQRTQFQIYMKANRAEITALLSNPMIADHVGALIKFLKKLGPNEAPILVDYICNSKWLMRCDEYTRQTVLSMISAAIIKIRVQHGLPPFDDSLGNLFEGDPNQEPPNAFQIIRKHLMGG